MLCQPLNAASLVAFVGTAWAQRWFSCKLTAAPCVKRAWPVCRQPVRAPPACYISIAWWGTWQHLTVSSCCFFFFSFLNLSRKKNKAWEKNQDMPAFLWESLNALHCNNSNKCVSLMFYSRRGESKGESRMKKNYNLVRLESSYLGFTSFGNLLNPPPRCPPRFFHGFYLEMYMLFNKAETK